MTKATRCNIRRKQLYATSHESEKWGGVGKRIRASTRYQNDALLSRNNVNDRTTTKKKVTAKKNVFSLIIFISSFSSFFVGNCLCIFGWINVLMLLVCVYALKLIIYSNNIYIMPPFHFVDGRMGGHKTVKINIGAFTNGVWL